MPLAADNPITTYRAGAETGTIQVSFMKNPKRKRLAKACDACHKSKRRCDGTAPCSNCFFASKDCTYTDASGRPVPAPKAPEHMQQRFRDLQRPSQVAHETHSIQSRQVMEVSSICQPETPPAMHTHPSSSSGISSHSRKRHRSDSSLSEAPSERKWHHPEHNGRPTGLDPNLVRELVGLFFTHGHPFRMILHMPSFIAALSRNTLPPFLVLAVCAVAAPFSKSSQVKTSPPRMAGVRLYQEAVNIMFDAAGRLICEPTLMTVQALCLLECHEVYAQYSWAKGFRYIELASRIVRGMLEDQKNDTHTPTMGSAQDLELSNERECLRRCSWLIYFMDTVAVAFTRLPSRVPSHDVSIRLPVDETSFELGVQMPPEYLDKPAPRTNASEVGHVIRLVTYLAKLEDSLALDDESMVREGLSEVVKDLDNWSASLPDSFSFTEENLQLQQSMFETSANMGAWSFYFVHSMHPCCMLSIAKADHETSGLDHPAYSRAKSCVKRIVASLGNRAINSNYLISCVLWIMSRHFGGDHEIQTMDAEYERVWGYKCLEIAPTWRKCHPSTRKPEERREQIMNHVPNIRELSLRPIDQGVNPGRECHYMENERRGNIESRNDRDLDARESWQDDTRRPGDGDMKCDRESLPSLKAVGLLDSFETRTDSPITSGMKGRSSTSHW